MFGGGGPLKMGAGAGGAVGAANKEKIAEVKAWIKEVREENETWRPHFRQPRLAS